MMPVASPISDDQLAIRNLVKTYDRDRYWSALFAPEPARSHLLTLYAFNVELSRIAEQVSEPMFGELRLQWWRDALELAAEIERTGHPVADALAKTRIGFGLPEATLSAMIDARIFDIGRAPMADIPALKTYLTTTAGGVFRLGCLIVGVRGDNAERACEHAAMAYGLTGLLRALPFHASRGQLFLPASHFAQHNIAIEDILRGVEKPPLRKALGALASAARRYLASFRAEATKLPPEALPVFLPLALIEAHLDKLAAPDHRPLAHIAGLNPAYRYWLMLRAWRRKAI